MIDISCGRYVLNLTARTHIMGILNVTPDSFFDGGLYNNIDRAIFKVEQMIEEGADIIDIGGESSRPGSDPISEDEEIKRIKPIVHKLLKKKLNIPISIDTYKASVAKMALDEGVSIVNDITGLHFDLKMASVVKEYNVPVIIMHTLGKPKNMQTNPQYNSLMTDIIKYLKNGIQLAIDTGIDSNKIIIDPGIGFGKKLNDNLAILKFLPRLSILKKPILVGLSRKSFIGNLLNLPVGDRLEGSLAATAIAVMNGANIIRTHDIKETKGAIKIAEAIKKAS